MIGRLKSVYTITLAVFVVGVAVLFVRSWWPSIESSPHFESLLESIGAALVTAAALALTVDAALKTGLVRDAFQTSFGYILPEELKPELRAIYEHRILCTRHEQYCELTRVGEIVVLHMRLYRTFKNFSDEMQSIPIRLAIDEWFTGSRPSRIISLGYSKGDKAIDLISAQRGVQELPPTLADGVWLVEGDKVSLGAGEEIRTWSEFEETKQLNDVHYMFFTAPTNRPMVTLAVKDDSGQIAARVSFAHRKAGQVVRAGERRDELPGTLLMSQPIEIRWWNKNDEALLREQRSPSTQSS